MRVKVMRVKRAGLLLGSIVASALVPLGAVADEVRELGPVVVSASGFEQRIESAPATISVVSREELEKGAFRDVTDALRQVPGVLITGSGSSTDISIRGMDGKYTMLLVDGKPVSSREIRPNSDGPGIEQGFLPPLEAIERIEVVRGPMSSLYGSDAMGGVVNIITRKVSKRWHSNVRLEGTGQENDDSGNGYNTSFYLAGPLAQDKLGLEIYGGQRYREEDDIIDGFGEQKVRTGTVKLSFTPTQDHDLIAEFTRTLQDRNAYPGHSIEAIGRGGKPATPSLSRYANNRYSLTHIGRYAALQSNTYVQREESDNPGRDMALTNTEVNSQWQLPVGNHILTMGAHYTLEELDDKGNQYNPRQDHLNRYQWALFAEDEWWLADSLSVTSGLRMSHDENYGNHWTPRLYGVWHLASEWTLKGGVSSGFKAPGLRQSTPGWGQITGGRGSAVPAIIMGNPDLKPEKSVSEEIGLAWSDHAGNRAGVTLFNTDFKDKISELRRCTDPTGGAGCHVQPGDSGYKFISDRMNVDKAMMRGVELDSQWRLAQQVTMGFNYTYTESEQKSGDFSGKPLNQLPKHMANARIDWAVNSKLGLWTRANFRGETSDYLSRTSMKDGTPSFFFMGTGVNYQMAPSVKVGVAVYNLLDKQVDAASYDAVYDGRRYWAYVDMSF